MHIINNSIESVSAYESVNTADSLEIQSAGAGRLLNKLQDLLSDLYIQIKKLMDKLVGGAQSDKTREIVNSDKMSMNVAEMRRKSAGLTSSATLKNAWGQIGGAMGGIGFKGLGFALPKQSAITNILSDASSSIIPASVSLDANSLTREANSIEISAGYASSCKDSYMKQSNATENMAKYRQLSIDLDRMLTEMHGALANAIVIK
ncbi:hypothetical protein D5952_14075 [Salmonella enterica subsp. enterica]|nr:hypothetical protein [Salmonella enterica subsp. enterica serovar Bonn]EBZ5939308.1 hypothetical protein [Salmonella enterica subsp. enterica serovar Muenchen]MLZ41051.1 hypothetical protein [Salmonella enterica subsp. enterica serovar Bonn]